MKKIYMADGSLLEDENISWWHIEDDNEVIIGKVFHCIMDFTIHFPYWEELKPPTGYNSIVKIGEVWYWTFNSNN